MDITPLLPKNAKPITGYGNNSFTIGEEEHQGSVIITNTIISWSPAKEVEQLTQEDLSEILNANPKPEIVLLGTGTTLKRPADTLLSCFKQQGISLDFMDTGAACRTYNVLLSEARKVAVAVYSV